jgi:hypothetical protein
MKSCILTGYMKAFVGKNFLFNFISKKNFFLNFYHQMQNNIDKILDNCLYIDIRNTKSNRISLPILENRKASRRINNNIMIHLSKIYLTWRESYFQSKKLYFY